LKPTVEKRVRLALTAALLRRVMGMIADIAVRSAMALPRRGVPLQVVRALDGFV